VQAAPSATVPFITYQACLPDGTVEIRANWSSASAGPQWADLSLLRNGFFPGTFVSQGQLTPAQSDLVWDGLIADRVHFLRINTLTADGWGPSASVAFVTRSDCAGLTPLANGAVNVVDQACSPNGTLQVGFSWAPPPGGFGQWIDLSLVDNGFAPGTFIGEPAGTGNSFLWSGLLSAQFHYVRVNTLTPTGWQSTPTMAFLTEAC
jgi:hypothetical protein